MNGDQPERTGLAWQRTALASAACSGLLLHAALTTGHAAPAIALPVSLVTTVVLAAAGTSRGRRLRRSTAPLPLPLAATAALLVTATTVVSLAALLAALTIGH
ncbi:MULTISPECIES: DUF202 domain-containing protein [Prauserella salsuginis group]|uniref:DUF202 domain-containing protein n=1 Tax=Prauserella salsuginis TaxID=387889 RepID=A0ABW6G5D5_9PSEU|nr:MULTISPECIES: DUF202 domain-containing protein [Prauserella salsuginis group]MCR3718940.1 protein of unknown function (DUF202) [Prauserella flava]MCR3733510.1 protein of unknown function (DUF202) [Prauserella salsuginis]